MDFQHPVQSFNDLHAGRDLGGFQSHVGTVLISIPGEISTNSEACPAIGRKPCDTVAKNEPPAAATIQENVRA